MISHTHGNCIHEQSIRDWFYFWCCSTHKLKSYSIMQNECILSSLKCLQHNRAAHNNYKKITCGK